MSYARLRIELLTARDAREALLAEQRAATSDSLVLVSTAIPGVDKTPPRSRDLFAWGMARLHQSLTDCQERVTEYDLLGPYGIVATPENPYQVKTVCLAIEAALPAARLLDLDVYAADGQQIGRRELGASARPCLLCTEPAVDCIRLHRHPLQELYAHVTDLLDSFTPTSTG